MRRTLRILVGIAVIGLAVPLLSTTARASAATPATTSAPFSDVAGTSPFAADIAWLSAHHIVGGYKNGTFRPTQNVSREAMAAFLYRLDGSPAYKAPAHSTFADVPTTSEFYKEISWLASTGITTGYTTGDFEPTAPITREAMAAFLYRYAAMKHIGETTDYTPPQSAVFLDVTQPSTFYTEVSWLAATGITTGWDVGFSCRQFRPVAQVTREATAAFLYRIATGTLTPSTASPSAGCSFPAGAGSLPGSAGAVAVGSALAPGTYESVTPATSEVCYWARLSSEDTSGAAVITDAAVGPGERTIVTVSPTDADFETADCGTWQTVTGPTSAGPAQTIPGDGGEYIVGWDVKPGTYVSTTPSGSQGCYWQRLANASGASSAVTADGIVPAGSAASVTISASDRIFSTQNCGTWTLKK